MDHKGRVNAVASMLLNGDGLEVAKLLVDDRIDQVRDDKTDSGNDRLESLYMLRRELRKLGEEKDGAP